jgi:uncharacterized protein (DUF305 family)
MRITTRIGTLAGAVALSLALAACGTNSDSASGMDHSTSASSSSSSAPSSAAVDAAHNAADISFTQDMIGHHQGAIAMAQLASSRASSPQVKDLASRIEAAQSPEINEMTSWLTAWGEPTASTDSSMGPGGMGMMTDEQMNQLTAATGTAFDRMFLQMMTVHHQGAIDMAKTEQANGSNPQAIALARSIETSQTAEVTEMAQLLKTL